MTPDTTTQIIADPDIIEAERAQATALGKQAEAVAGIKDLAVQMAADLGYPANSLPDYFARALIAQLTPTTNPDTALGAAMNVVERIKAFADKL